MAAGRRPYQREGDVREDAELVRLAAGGDNAAFAELYERYFDNVYDFLVRMVRNREEAADLAQDTFLRAMNGLGSLSKGGSFKSWLFTIARNTALNRMERTSRLQPLAQETADGEEVELQVVDTSRFSDPEQAAQASAYAALVWEAAASLDPRSYAVLDLSVRQNLSSEELAEVLGVKRNNAYVMVNRMKSALEDAIGSLALMRNGRRECAALDAALSKLQIAELTPEARKVVDRHARGCKTCKEQRRNLASPFAVFAALGLVYPANELRSAILDNVTTEFEGTYGGALDASTFLAELSDGEMPDGGELIAHGHADAAADAGLDAGVDEGPDASDGPHDLLGSL
jgi:RNA polymerase sigma factor (sigma-70 family)